MAPGEVIQTIEGAPRASADSHRPAARDSAPSRAEDRPRSHGPAGFLLWCFASLAFGGLGGYLANHYDQVFEALGVKAGSGERTSHAKVSDATIESIRSETARASDVKTLAGRIDKLALETSGLRVRFDSQPKADECPSLTALQIKVAELSKLAEEVSPLPGKMDRSDSRLETMNLILNGIQEDVESLKSKAPRTADSSSRAAMPPALAALLPPPQPSATASGRHEASKPVLRDTFGEVSKQALERGADLFKQEKYKEAFENFSRLELSSPDDARIWYYAALSRGLATKIWGNGTEQLVERGIECERAGNPKSSEIDATFRDLTSATGKDWLGAYRQRVKDR